MVEAINNSDGASGGGEQLYWRLWYLQRIKTVGAVSRTYRFDLQVKLHCNQQEWPWKSVYIRSHGAFWGHYATSREVTGSMPDVTVFSIDLILPALLGPLDQLNV